ncbi:MAG: transporter substrate-binding domain-containing protein [Pseudomonadota bacterium]
MRFVLCCVFGVFALTKASVAQTADASTIDSVTKSGVLRVGWAVYFPYMFQDPRTQQVSGISVDLFNEIGKELGAKVEFVEDNWSTMIAGLQARKFDLMIPVANTPARAEMVGFTIPMIKIALGMAVLKKDADKYHSWQDLDKAGLRVSTTMGSSVHTALAPQLKTAELLLMKSGSESVAQVLSGRADAWANTYDAFMFMQKEQPGLTVVPGAPFGYDVLALSYRKGDLKTKQWLEQFIVKERDSGALLRIISKYGLDASYIAQ